MPMPVTHAQVCQTVGKSFRPLGRLRPEVGSLFRHTLFDRPTDLDGLWPELKAGTRMYLNLVFRQIRNILVHIYRINELKLSVKGPSSATDNVCSERSRS